MSKEKLEYIDNKRLELKKLRDKELIKIGAIEKVYSEKSYITEEFPYIDRDNDNSRAYKIIALDVTDEEYKEIISIAKEIECYNVNSNKSEKINKENKVASMFGVISILIYTLGGLASFFYLISAMINYYYNAYIYFFSFIIIGLSTFITGTIFLGFKEIIILLQKISYNISVKE